MGCLTGWCRDEDYLQLHFQILQQQLFSNEWKKETASIELAIEQQTKNVRANETILNLLRSLMNKHGQFVFYMYWYENDGYMSAIECKDNYYLANNWCSLSIPQTLKAISLLKGTIQHLFSMKYYYMTMYKAVTIAINEDKRKAGIGYLVGVSHCAFAWPP